MHTEYKYWNVCCYSLNEGTLFWFGFKVGYKSAQVSLGGLWAGETITAVQLWRHLVAK